MNDPEIVPARSQYHLLIVDDNPEDRRTYKRYLSQSRVVAYEFSEAESVAEGLELFAGTRPACVLLDYQLPDGSGLDFLNRVVADYPSHEVCVVMLTGYGDEDVIVNVMKRGAMDYMSKARLNADALCRTVYKALEKGALLRTLHEREAEKDHLIHELRQALDQIKTLRGIVPICANCKNIRDDKGFWQQVEVYFHDHTDAQFSHGICPECVENLYPEMVPDAEAAASS